MTISEGETIILFFVDMSATKNNVICYHNIQLSKYFRCIYGVKESKI
jgi:hypothetical protein